MTDSSPSSKTWTGINHYCPPLFYPKGSSVRSLSFVKLNSNYVHMPNTPLYYHFDCQSLLANLISATDWIVSIFLIGRVNEVNESWSMDPSSVTMNDKNTKTLSRKSLF